MNINDVTVTVPKGNISAFFNDFLTRRHDRFTAFCETEKKNGGLVAPHVSLSTVRGQEAFRILSFRIIEEVSESIDAEDVDHKIEEVTDALNYLFSIPFLDLRVVSVEAMVTLAVEKALAPQAFRSTSLDYYDLGYISFLLGMKVGDFLRNRSWTENPQDVYFSGGHALLSAIGDIMSILFTQFKDVEQMKWFLIAKDEVLKFRIQSRY